MIICIFVSVFRYDISSAVRHLYRNVVSNDDVENLRVISVKQKSKQKTKLLTSQNTKTT